MAQCLIRRRYWVGAPRGPVLFTDLDNGIKCAYNKFVNNSKLSEVTGSLETGLGSRIIYSRAVPIQQEQVKNATLGMENCMQKYRLVSD